MQQTWLRGIQWDDPLPSDIDEAWRELDQQLASLDGIQFPRAISKSKKQYIEFHVFADASERAYAAALFVKIISADNSSSIKLVASKTKAAPVKSVSIPRLELCGAHLASKLVCAAKNALSGTNFKINNVYGWTDSMIVEAWLSDLPRRWNCFVANRVASIQENIPPENWFHVPTDDNPADCASRGISIQELKNHKLWWNGPPWLLADQRNWPDIPLKSPDIIPEEKAFSGATISGDLLINFSRFSSVKKFSYICFCVPCGS